MSAEPIHLQNSTPFDIITESINDALLEAKNWADGNAAETQEQVDEIARLIDDLNDNAKALEAERVSEKKPLDDKIQAIQDRYNVYLAPLKNKTPGKVPTAIDALNAAKRPFLLKREQEIEAARKKAADEAAAKAKEAAEALAKANAADLESREAAEVKVKEAEDAQRAAKVAANDRAHAFGGGRAQGLRTRTIATITDLNAAVRHYWMENPQPFAALVQKLADDDARQSRKAVEGKGVTFHEERY